MNIKKIIALSIISTLSACSQISETSTPESLVNQLTGTWKNEKHGGKVIFYPDQTAKIVFPKHQPPIKLISTYEKIKDKSVGINLGGFWSGPAFINTSNLQEQHLTITFPDEKPIALFKMKHKDLLAN